MRLYPDTLFGRLMTALLVVVLVTGSVVAWLVMREREEVVFWGGESADLVEILASVSQEIAALPPEARPARVQELRQTPIAFGEDSDRQRKRRQFDIAAAVRSYEKQLQRELGRDYQVDVRPAARGSQVAIQVGMRWRGDDGRSSHRSGGSLRRVDPLRQLDVVVGLPDGGQVAYRVPAPLPGQPLPRGIFVQLAILTLVLAVVLFLMARGITRPLSALASSAEAMSRGETTPPLPETGASELKDATRAFNTMHERLQRYMNSRNSLLAAISHDLRTPLTRLRLRSEKIHDPELRERFQHDVDEMNDMLKATLDLFRGMNDDEPMQPVDIMALLRSICVEFAEMGSDIPLSGSAVGVIEAKQTALKRCITNLVANAIAYGGSAAIEVCDGDTLEIRVIDQGPGIPEAQLEKVLEPFYRLDSSRNPETGGSGLGLSIARDIAQAHGGSLNLENGDPKGLVAVLSLPRR